MQRLGTFIEKSAIWIAGSLAFILGMAFMFANNTNLAKYTVFQSISLVMGNSLFWLGELWVVGEDIKTKQIHDVNQIIVLCGALMTCIGSRKAWAITNILFTLMLLAILVTVLFLTRLAFKKHTFGGGDYMQMPLLVLYMIGICNMFGTDISNAFYCVIFGCLLSIATTIITGCAKHEKAGNINLPFSPFLAMGVIISIVAEAVWIA